MSATPARQQLAVPAAGAWPSGALLWRVAALSTALVFVQIGVVSELPLFGVSVDLSPLLVAFVGLLCGSMVGAVTGFGVGLLVDVLLMQTLGVSSLVFTLVGYAAGRLRELRDPQAALTPLLVGAGAAASAMLGYSLLEFLLGVDAPVSYELLRQIVVGVLLDAVVALPVWALVRRCLIGGLPEDPRRRRRRAYTTGGLSPLSRSSRKPRNSSLGRSPGSKRANGAGSGGRAGDSLGPLSRAPGRKR